MKNVGLFVLLCAAICSGPSARGHVPYLERKDVSEASPFVISDITQSLAFYGWLQAAGDVDVYKFDISQPTRLKIEFLVPACPNYANFNPSFVVVGPGLPPPAGEMPIQLPAGYGAFVPEEIPTGARTIMYEPFGGKHYYEGPEFDATIETSGKWYIVVWDRTGMVGDYVMAPGYVESFKGPDLVRALINTKIIRKNGELHTKCR